MCLLAVVQSWGMAVSWIWGRGQFPETVICSFSSLPESSFVRQLSSRLSPSLFFFFLGKIVQVIGKQFQNTSKEMDDLVYLYKQGSSGSISPVLPSCPWMGCVNPLQAGGNKPK